MKVKCISEIKDSSAVKNVLQCSECPIMNPTERCTMKSLDYQATFQCKN